MKADYYEIEATVKILYKVQFEDPVTFQEARDMFLSGEYADIYDEEPLSTISVDRVIQIGV